MELIGQWRMANGQIATLSAYYERAKLYEGVIGGSIFDRHVTIWNYRGENMEDPEWDLKDKVGGEKDAPSTSPGI